jgi:GNAT superfamily N-acetyltransferase
MIRECRPEDAPRILDIINQAATAYGGVIPDDCYHQPYMSAEELAGEMRRVRFLGWEEEQLVGVMGIEPVADVTLIRHAYVLPRWQRRGIGSRLLKHLIGLTGTGRLLVGTWAAASWAIDFYRRHGFELEADGERLLETYWDIPRRQIETSVVLAIDLHR